MKEGSEDDEGFKLDVVVAASGFKQSEQRVLEEVCNLWSSHAGWSHDSSFAFSI